MNFFRRLKEAWDNDEDIEVEIDIRHLVFITGIVIVILLNIL